MSLAQDFRSSAGASQISPIGPVAHGWIASNVTAHGVVGAAHLATAEKGEATANKMVADFTQGHLADCVQHVGDRGRVRADVHAVLKT